MTDIVERLRSFSRDDADVIEPEQMKAMLEAADVIEQLRDRLANSIAISGKAERGPSFAEITKDFPRAPKDLCGNE